MRSAMAAAILVAALLSPAAASADTTAEVSAQVTAASPCVTAGDSIDYGTLRFSTTDPWFVVSESGSTTFTNCSAAAEKIYVRGTRASSTSSDAVWQLNDSTPCDVGPDSYSHQANDSETFIWLTGTDQLLVDNAAAGATTTMRTVLLMPCSGSVGSGDTMTFSIVITASF